MAHARFWSAATVLLCCAFVSPAATGVFRDHAIPGAPGGLTDLVRGSDGGFWFTEFDANRIGTFSRDGQFREFTVPTPNSGPRGIASGGDAVWFTEFRAGKIGKLTSGGVFSEYVIPSQQSAPWGIVFGTSGMWFTESGANKIGLIRDDGTITETPIPTANSEPRGIDSFGVSLCFAEFRANQIGCLGFQGAAIQERGIPTPNAGAESVGVTDLGNIWFTESLVNRIGVIRFFNVPTLLEAPVEEFAVPTPASDLQDLRADFNGGGAWFTEGSSGQVGFISNDGRITEYPLSDRSSRPTGIVLDVGVRFLESTANRLVEIQPDAVLVAGAGESGNWSTEFQLANAGPRPVTVFAGALPLPPAICPNSCFAVGVAQLPPFGTGQLDSRDMSVGDIRPFFVRALEEGALPSVKARIYNRSVRFLSADLPTIRLSTLTILNPSTLTFPGAIRSGSARSNLLISDIDTVQMLEGSTQTFGVRVDLITADGETIASGEVDLSGGTNTYLVDIIGRLGVTTFPGGQIRVTKLGEQGLLWGYLATVNADGAISIFSGLNP